MGDTLALLIDPPARTQIVAELGSMNSFNDRLASLVARESQGRALISEVSGELADGMSSRGGEILEIVTAVSGLIATLSPVVIAWLRSRSLEVVQEVEETHEGGKVVRLHVRRGFIK